MCLYLRHFLDPLLAWDQAGLWGYDSQIVWALNFEEDFLFRDNRYSWPAARKYFHNALINDNSEYHYAKMFRALGQLMHLVSDAAVPAHVRNDPHPGMGAQYIPYIGTGLAADLYEKWAKDNFDKEAEGKINYDGRPYVDETVFTRFDATQAHKNPITALWDQNYYTGGNPTITWTENVGLAEFTNANFVSQDTKLSDYPHPDLLASPIDVLNPILVLAEDGKWDEVFYVMHPDKGYRLSKLTYTAKDGVTSVAYGEDDNVWQDYAAELIPRAVGYSTALLKFFFRGEIEISAPDTFVYGIIDGSQAPHYFTLIKAKIRNTTPNEEMQAGTLVAVAKYRKRLDYDLDLSTDPPIYESSEEDFSYSVSESIAVSGVSSSSPAAYTFDFTNDPIPAGVTDLYLQVVFKGTLGNEADIAVAVGMTDLNEPQHLVFWNCTDYFLLDGEPRKAADIENDPEAASYGYIRPYSFTENVGFSAAAPDGNTPFVATFENLPPGRYGKLIVLTDAPSDFWVKDHLFSTPYDLFPDQVLDDATFTYTFSTIENQTTAEGTWQNTPVYDVRGVMQHQMTYFIRDYPIFVYDPYSIPEPDIDNGPFPATIVFP